MTTLPRPAILCLTGGALFALVGFVTQTDAHEVHRFKADGLRCAVVAHDLGDAVEISGKVTSDHTVSGAYDLRIRHHSSTGQAMIDQSGDFTVGAGRTVTLGQAVLSGPARSYRSELDLTVNGQRLRCLGADQHSEI